MQMDGQSCRQRCAERQTAFVPHRDREGGNITVLGSGTRRRPPCVRKRSRCSFCSLFFFAPPARQVTRPWQSEGQRAESQGRTHIHTKTLHQYYKPVFYYEQFTSPCYFMDYFCSERRFLHLTNESVLQKCTEAILLGKKNYTMKLL